MKTTHTIALLFVSVVALSLPAQTLTPEGTRISIPNTTFPVDVLVKSPAEAPGELQIICLFRSDPENKLLASLAILNQHLGGLLGTVRTQTLFRGDLGETLLITPKPGIIAEKRLLIVGLGDRPSFTADREELIGEIVYTESERLRIAAPSFAPTILDGGATVTDTGAVGASFMRGFLRGRALAAALHSAAAGPEFNVRSLTFLAGTTHAIDTRNGLASVLTAK